MGVKLKPCPFCGGDATKPYNEQAGTSRKPVWEIGCSLFCVSMRRGTKKGICEDWNQRTEQTTEPASTWRKILMCDEGGRPNHDDLRADCRGRQLAINNPAKQMTITLEDVEWAYQEACKELGYEPTP